MPPNRVTSGSAEGWLARARGSLALAKGPRSEEVFLEDQCFLAQQAAEKAMKAVYQHRGLVFRYTHDLEELGKGLEDKDVLLPDAVKDAVILTRYAFETRYPGPFEPVTEDEYKEAMRLAGCVVDWAGQIIQERAKKK
ncbi:MAG: HEPN domain-containing protein [Candidatus Binatia bacterium]